MHGHLLHNNHAPMPLPRDAQALPCLQADADSQGLGSMALRKKAKNPSCSWSTVASWSAVAHIQVVGCRGGEVATLRSRLITASPGLMEAAFSKLCFP